MTTEEKGKQLVGLRGPQEVLQERGGRAVRGSSVGSVWRQRKRASGGRGGGTGGGKASHTQTALSSSAHLCGCLPSVSMPRPGPTFLGAPQALSARGVCRRRGRKGKLESGVGGRGPDRGAYRELSALARPLVNVRSLPPALRTPWGLYL